MKIISYNVNGIRAVLEKQFIEWLESTNPDIVCLQEIKALPEQIEISRFKEIGYKMYIHSAKKRGYSGVAILTKVEPKRVLTGIGNTSFDNEGRVIQLDYENFSVISVYVPSGSNMDRLDFKLEFCNTFFTYIKELQKKISNLVICGDYNICHQAIDIHDPKRNAKVSGFLPVEREWLSLFMKELNIIDSFRYFVKEPHHYSWWSYRANSRNNNKGWRIDYIMVSQSLEKNMQRAYILPQAKHSDHCPVGVDLFF